MRSTDAPLTCRGCLGCRCLGLRSADLDEAESLRSVLNHKNSRREERAAERTTLCRNAFILMYFPYSLPNAPSMTANGVRFQLGYHLSGRVNASNRSGLSTLALQVLTDVENHSILLQHIAYRFGQSQMRFNLDKRSMLTRSLEVICSPRSLLP